MRSKYAGGRVPLANEIATAGLLRVRSKKRKSAKGGEDGGEGYVDSTASRKILKISRDLVDEDEEAVNGDRGDGKGGNLAFEMGSRGFWGGLDDDEEEEEEEGEGREAWGDEEDEGLEEVDVDPKDLDMFNRFASREEQGGATNLADLILEKIAAHEATQGGQSEEPVIHGGGRPEDAVEMNPKVVQVYSTIGLLLSRYKSGKLPKPFKIIPTLPQWEELLALTRPDQWTPNACYEATKIFVSQKPHIVQTFLETVILDRVKEDIYETKKLNVHLFKALKKALYKPAAFFKGFLFPLVSDGTCTLREAHIISSVLVRVSVPVLHSAAALLRLTEIAAEQTLRISSESAGATNIFIRVLLEKKYALPYKVIDGLVFHFLRFRATPAADQMLGTDDQVLGSKDLKLPVLWHQCLLAFAQRYRNDITEDQREALLDLLLVRGHKDIGPEARRELLEGRGRGVVVGGMDVEMGGEGDDTMVVD